MGNLHVDKWEVVSNSNSSDWTVEMTIYDASPVRVRVLRSIQTTQRSPLCSSYLTYASRLLVNASPL